MARTETITVAFTDLVGSSAAVITARLAVENPEFHAPAVRPESTNAVR